MPVGKNEWPFQFAHVPIDECFVDYGYQRPSRPEFIAEKSKPGVYDRDLILALVGSVRKDGRRALVDGGQRWMIVREVGEAVVPMLYKTGMTYEEEALMFVNLNFARGNVMPFFRYRGMLEAKVPLALDIERRVEAEGFRVARSASGSTAIGAVGALEDVYLALPDIARQIEGVNGPELLSSTLWAIRDGWSSFETFDKAKTGGMIRGVARWLAEHKEVPKEELARVLRHVEPNAVFQAAQSKSQGSGSGKGRRVEQAIHDVYMKHGKRELLAKRAA